MRIILLIPILLFSIGLSYSQNNLNQGRCIPFLIDNQRGEKIYIHDSCIEDTLKIQFKVVVNFGYLSSDPEKTMVVKSVNLMEMTIRSLNPQKIISSLSNVVEIESPWEQYVWDLCYAKLSYWYKYQPYGELPEKERTRYGDKIYMGGILYLVPENCALYSINR
jgi:hypothetical protein